MIKVEDMMLLSVQTTPDGKNLINPKESCKI